MLRGRGRWTSKAGLQRLRNKVRPGVFKLLFENFLAPPPPSSSSPCLSSSCSRSYAVFKGSLVCRPEMKERRKVFWRSSSRNAREGNISRERTALLKIRGWRRIIPGRVYPGRELIEWMPLSLSLSKFC